MNNKADRNEKILAIVIVIAVLFLGIYKIFFDKEVIEEEKIDTETISIVKDNSKFYTVSSCVSKYITYLSSGQTDKLLVLLSKNYKEKNSINLSNIHNYIDFNGNTSAFNPRKMFQQRLSKNVYKYYVSGYIEEETIDSIPVSEQFYIIVILDEKNMTFEIEPYDGDMFK